MSKEIRQFFPLRFSNIENGRKFIYISIDQKMHVLYEDGEVVKIHLLDVSEFEDKTGYKELIEEEFLFKEHLSQFGYKIQNKSCKCPTLVLCNSGCQCGAFKLEMSQ